jgi:hypothetical protein
MLLHKSAADSTGVVGVPRTLKSGTDELEFANIPLSILRSSVSDAALTLKGHLVAASGFDLLLDAAAGQDAVLKLGDAAGAKKFSILDSGSVEQFYVNSDGNVWANRDLSVARDLRVSGNMYVDGTTTTIRTGDVLIEDRFVLNNFTHVEAYGQGLTAGQVYVIKPLSAALDIVGAVASTGRFSVQSNPSPTLSIGHIIAVKGMEQPENNGLFLVKALGSNYIEVEPTPAAALEGYINDALIDESGSAGKAANVYIAIFRADAVSEAGADPARSFSAGFGSSFGIGATDIAFDSVSGADSITLQKAYDNANGNFIQTSEGRHLVIDLDGLNAKFIVDGSGTVQFGGGDALTGDLSGKGEGQLLGSFLVNATTQTLDATDFTASASDALLLTGATSAIFGTPDGAAQAARVTISGTSGSVDITASEDSKFEVSGAANKLTLSSSSSDVIVDAGSSIDMDADTSILMDSADIAAHATDDMTLTADDAMKVHGKGSLLVTTNDSEAQPATADVLMLSAGSALTMKAVAEAMLSSDDDNIVIHALETTTADQGRVVITAEGPDSTYGSIAIAAAAGNVKLSSATATTIAAGASSSFIVEKNDAAEQHLTLGVKNPHASGTSALILGTLNGSNLPELDAMLAQAGKLEFKAYAPTASGLRPLNFQFMDEDGGFSVSEYVSGAERKYIDVSHALIAIGQSTDNAVVNIESGSGAIKIGSENQDSKTITVAYEGSTTDSSANAQVVRIGSKVPSSSTTLYAGTGDLALQAWGSTADISADAGQDIKIRAANQLKLEGDKASAASILMGWDDRASMDTAAVADIQIAGGARRWVKIGTYGATGAKVDVHAGAAGMSFVSGVVGDGSGKFSALAHSSDAAAFDMEAAAGGFKFTAHANHMVQFAKGSVGVPVTNKGTGSLVVGDVVALSGDAGEWGVCVKKAQANGSEAQRRAFGVIRSASISEDAAGLAASVPGTIAFVKLVAAPASGDAGKPVYLASGSADKGKVTLDAPVDAGCAVMQLGYLNSHVAGAENSGNDGLYPVVLAPQFLGQIPE